ncbi:unnamed protein product [Spirodela intermedia]|uniref:Uncharacterized protein n=1 Tax=Spirodela intermedia TaxID=51605 RepID=A0A7I8JDF0_SPIIN|nr:unnamed protein product [Spirodela intermedia]CAA6668188.1 unnamed protein product [Spirodela intermedia]
MEDFRPGEGEEVAAPARADEIGASSGEEIFCAPEVEEKLADVKQMEEAGDRETFIPILRVGREVTPLPEGEELLEETFPPADCSVLAVSTVKLSVLIESSSSSSEPTSSTEEQSSFPAEVESVVSQSRDDKGLATEETIWKQIDAIRMIAGSNRPPQPSCVEEVKALYLFVGIEPPISFEECSDLENVDDKLQFLKSIIGVK